MKKIIICLFFCFFVSISIKAEWVTVNSPTTTQIYTVHFLNENTGFVTTFYKIYKTTNAGVSWYEVFSGDRIPQVMAFTEDINIGYVACYYSNGGRILKTTNQGETWFELGFEILQAPSNIYIDSPTDIYISCYGQTVIHTIDGGSTWSLDSLQAAYMLNGIGKISGNMYANSVDSWFKKIANGSWQNMGNYGIYSYAGFVLNNNTVYIGGGTWPNAKAAISSSINQGQNWSVQELSDSGSITSLLFSEGENFAAGEISKGGENKPCIWRQEGSVWFRDTVLFTASPGSRFTKLCNAGYDLYAVGSNGIIMKYNQGLLPTELSSFNSLVNNNSVTLNWITVSETNNARFDIERSENGEWRKIGNVLGSGTITEIHQYSFNDKNVNPGVYNYRLKQVDYNGNYEYHYLNSQVIVGIPNNYKLSQNYPNPFNPETNINYSIPTDGLVTLQIYDIIGKEVMTVVHEQKTAGYYTVRVNASSLGTGVYMYRLKVGNFTSTKRMTVIK